MFQIGDTRSAFNMGSCRAGTRGAADVSTFVFQVLFSNVMSATTRTADVQEQRMACVPNAVIRRAGIFPLVLWCNILDAQSSVREGLHPGACDWRLKNASLP